MSNDGCADVIDGEDLHLAKVDELEIFSRDRIFVAAAQEAHVVRVLEIFEAGGVTAELFEVPFDGARVLNSAVNEFIFAITLDLLRDQGSDGEGANRHQHYHQHDGEKKITGL